MSTFYFVRHGEKERVMGDPALTAKGHTQAEQTAHFLKQFPISLIVASPYLRTQQTAKHIAQHTKAPLQSSDLLKERANWGEDPNQTLEDFFKEWNQASWDRTFQPSVGDTSLQAGRRLEKAVAELSATPTQDQHIVLVTHGGVISDFLRNIFPEEKLESLIKDFSHGKGFEVPECSVTILEKTPTGFELKQLVGLEHLTEKS